MAERKPPRILDCRSEDHDYLHMDFHGALCYSIWYLDEHLGPDATVAYLTEVGRKNYKGLIRAMASEGLPALERHWRQVFSKERGQFRMQLEGDKLVLAVMECPAIAYLKRSGQLFTTRYCETTVVVNRTFCSLAGYDCSCHYSPGEGKCVQSFWRKKD